MSKKQVEITTVVIESQTKNLEIGRQFYHYIQDELKKIKKEK